MRTTLEIDETLIDETIRLTGEKNKGKAVNQALKAYIRRRRAEALIAMAGKMDLDLDDWYEFRHAERT